MHSPFLISLARKRGASKDLQQGLGAGMDTIVGGLEGLRRNLEESERQMYGRGIERRNQDRGDARLAREGETHLLETKLLQAKIDALIGGKPATQEKSAAVQAPGSSDEGLITMDDETRAAKMDDAFNRVRADEDADAAADEGRLAQMHRYLDENARSLDALTSKEAQAAKKEADANLKQAQGYIKIELEAPGSVPDEVWQKLGIPRPQARRMPPKQPKPRDVTPDAKGLAELQDAEKQLARIDSIIAEKKKFNTGPLADVAAEAAGAVLPDAAQKALGLDERAAWKAKVQRDLNEIIKEQSGAAVSASEMTRQLLAQLHTKLDDSTFERVAQQVRESYAKDLVNARARLTPQSRREAVSGATNGGDMVTVTDGVRRKTVPRSRWEAQPVPGWRIAQ